MVDKGFDSKMGARPLQRVIDKEIKRPLAKRMLFGDLKNGGILNIGVVDNNLFLHVKTKAPKVVVDETASIDSN